DYEAKRWIDRRVEISEAFQAFAPDLLVYNAGTDILEGDPLGRLEVSPEGVKERDEIVFSFARQRNIPIVMLTSGGYMRSSAGVIAESISNLHSKKLIDLAGATMPELARSLPCCSNRLMELPPKSCQLPVDVLVHVFSFLDPISLATAGCVCRSWNSEYKDANLWQKLFTVVLENTSFDPTRVLQLAGFELGDDDSSTPLRVKDVSIQKIGCWKKAFEIAVLRSPKLLYLFTRAQCLTCKATFWSSELCLQTFANQCSKKNFQEHKLRPLLLEQVVSFVLMGSRQAYNTKKDSDSDEDQYLPYAKLWEYAKWLR
ncbi:hypothetical protein SELMODRAFT_432551, partial [Selaginella moellendorffii]